MLQLPQPWLEFSKTMMNLDLTKATDDLTKLMAQLDVPGVDMDALVAGQKDNLEALATANRAALEGLKAAAEFQVKTLTETMAQLSSAAGALTTVSSPQDALGKQADVAKQAFEIAIRQVRDLADILRKANREASDAIIKRVAESLEEIKDVLKLKPQPAA